MFGPVLEKIDIWLGRSFLLARYFPWLLFAVANLTAASVEFPSVRRFLLGEYEGLGSGDKLLDLAIFLAIVAVAAFTLSPATQPVRRILEGQDLPLWLAEPLLIFHISERDRLVESKDRLFTDRAALPSTEELRRRLSDERNRGEARQIMERPRLISAAAEHLQKLRALRALNRHIAAADLNAAADALAAALHSNCADPSSLAVGATIEERTQSETLGRLHEEMAKKLAPYAIDVARSREAKVLERYDKLYAEAELTPTRLGNDTAALRNYAQSRYGFDFDLFWPRLQLVIKNDQLRNRLDAAEVQVDFSILCLVLTIAFMAVWLAILAVCGTSFALLVAVIILCPLLLSLWMWMTRESFTAYAGLIRAAIDLSRFDLFDALHLTLPKATTDEAAAWLQLERFLALSVKEPISYQESRT